MAAERSRVVVMAVGDTSAERDIEEAERLFAPSAAVLKQADILFGNCEHGYSDRGLVLNPNTGTRGTLCPARNAKVLKTAGFHVMSFTNNHHLDWGFDAFFDTLRLLRENGIIPVGAGKDIAEAKKPVVIERHGTRVAFLAYASVFWPGSEAAGGGGGAGKPGGAVVRAYTYYHQIEREQPGTDPKIFTFADPDDLEALQEDIAAAKSQADVVIIGFHWGIHYVPAKVAHYEKQVGRLAIDWGADVIVGNHQHIVKGIEVYKGKPIFHGVNEFVHDRTFSRRIASGAVPREPGLLYNWQRHGRHTFQPDGDIRSPEARKNLIVKAVIENKELVRTSYYPCLIDREDAAHPLKAGTPEFEEHLQYMRQISQMENLRVTLKPEEDEVLVLPG